MDALVALHTRNSVAALQEPGPNKDQLDNIIQSALRANDHRRLRPWKFLLVQGSAREELGKLMVKIGLQNDPGMTQQQQSKMLAKPLRAPTIIIVVATVKSECFDKVPEIEQILSAGGAAQLMMVAAHAQDVGAIWRTGSIAYDDRFKSGLGLEQGDQIVGLLYLGTAKAVKPLQELSADDFVKHWCS